MHGHTPVRALHRRYNMSNVGAPLFEILAAGQWKSPAFMAYLDVHRHAHTMMDTSHLLHFHAIIQYRLETDLVVEAHLAESDVEE